MDFLKKLNEEYRLFYIDPEDHSIEEVDLEDILDQGPPEGYESDKKDDEQPEDDADSDYEPESDEDDIDFSQFDNEDGEDDEKQYEPEPIDGDEEKDGNLDAYDLEPSNFTGHEHGEDGFQNPESKGEIKMDPNLTGFQFNKDADPDDPENYDQSEYHYPEVEDGHLSNRNSNNVSIDNDNVYSLNDTSDTEDENGFSNDEDQTATDDDYSDILGDMDLGSYLAKYAGHAAPEGDMQDVSDEDNLDQDGEGLEQDGMEGGEGEEDPDFQGVIRTVAGAVLVYKRQTASNLYDELWAFTSGEDNSIKSDSEIRRAILAGTDINPSTGQSESGEDETAETSTVGNVTFVKIMGLPS